MLFHLDLDSFFVSVERILDPSLEDKPVIVGGDPHGRGVVAACSYEAREYGLHSAMPIRQAYRLCPNGIYLHGHHKEYVRYSNSVKNILKKYAPVLEQASIDEFYIDFTGCEKIFGHPYFFASRIQAEIKKELNLPCSIGIASNKFVAKIASDYAKPQAITYVCPGQEVEFLAPLPVETMIGVGKVTKTELNARGFYKISDITKESIDYFVTAFGKYGKAIYEHALGKGSEFLTIEREQKSIGREETYSADTPDKKIIEATLFQLSEDACDSLRKNNWMARTIGIKLRYSDFVTTTRAKTLKKFTNDDKIIYETAVQLFKNSYTRRVSVRLIGIHLTNFCEFFEQENLFVFQEDKRKNMIEAINRIREKYGLKVIKIGVAD